MAYTIVNNFLPTSLYPLKSTYPMTPSYVTIHNTANDASAQNEIAFMIRNPTATSYHVAIDDLHAVQAIPTSRNAWHAGDGNGDGNRKSIGIEICYSKSGGTKYMAAEANAINYIASLLKQFGWGIERVRWHRDWSGKNCPHRIFAEGRSESVKNLIATRLAQLNDSSGEGRRMFKPSSTTLKVAFDQLLADAVRDGIIGSVWLTNYRAGLLSLDDAIAIKVIIDQRRAG